MASKGLRANHLSSYTEIDAGDELRIPLKPLLAIACVGQSCYFIIVFKSCIYNELNFITPKVFKC